MATAPTTMPERCWLPPWVKYLPTNGWGLDSLSGHYLGFLLYAFNEKKGAFAIS
jgi:hypothetical protein